jgi:hypothetical protein
MLKRRWSERDCPRCENRGMVVIDVQDTEIGCPDCANECDLCLAGYPPREPPRGRYPFGELITGVLRDASEFLGYVCGFHLSEVVRCRYAHPTAQPWPQWGPVKVYRPGSLHMRTRSQQQFYADRAPDRSHGQLEQSGHPDHDEGVTDTTVDAGTSGWAQEHESPNPHNDEAQSMDRIALYHKLARELVERIGAELLVAPEGIQSCVVTDTKHGHYLAMTLRGNQDWWLYGSYLHLHVTENQVILIEQNGTEEDISELLVAAGARQQDIVSVWLQYCDNSH